MLFQIVLIDDARLRMASLLEQPFDKLSMRSIQVDLIINLLESSVVTAAVCGMMETLKE